MGTILTGAILGADVDADGDGVANELTIADMTAITVFQATLPVPGRVLSHDPEIRKAEDNGEQLFRRIGCAACHVPELPITDKGWIYTEPNPYNPGGNLPVNASGYPFSVDLTSDDLPQPRLHPINGVVMVPAFTDLKLHDITSGLDDPNCELLNQNAPPRSRAFFGGNRMFLTRKLWGFTNEGPFMHHGKFTTIREAVLSHSGEALASRETFQTLSDYNQGSVIEFLKTLQVLPPGTRSPVVLGQGDSSH